MKLLELQRAFQAHVLAGTHGIEAIVPGTERFDTATRLGVYCGGYAERLTEALAQTFPAVRAALGPRAFGRLVDLLAHRSPSRHFSVRYYGEGLADLIAREIHGPRGRGASELARWEWLLAAAFDAPDYAALTRADLAAIEPAAWAGLRFALAPSLQRASLASNCVQWWKAACAEAPRPARWRIGRPRAWVAWRSELAIYFRPLGDMEAALLDAVLRDATFAEICAALAEHDARRAPVQAAQLLHTWLADGWIIELKGLAG
jgi:hypothetical protein